MTKAKSSFVWCAEMVLCSHADRRACFRSSLHAHNGIPEHVSCLLGCAARQALSIGICACHLIRKRNLKRADAKPNFDPVGRDSVDTTTMVHGDAQQEYPGPGGGHTQTYPGVPMQMQGAVVVAPVYAVATAMPVAQPQP